MSRRLGCDLSLSGLNAGAFFVAQSTAKRLRAYACANGVCWTGCLLRVRTTKSPTALSCPVLFHVGNERWRALGLTLRSAEFAHCCSDFFLP